MLVGYTRVSTTDQKLDGQKDALTEAGCERILTDTASGSRTDRPGLKAAMDTLRGGDVLVVWKLDRIGRSLPHLVQLVSELQEREVGFRVLSGEIDTTSAQGRLVFHLFAALAEFERELIRERTMAGLEAARARGRRGGRPPKMTAAKLRMAMTLMADRRNSAADVAEQLQVCRSTLYRYVDSRGQPKEPGRKLLSGRYPLMRGDVAAVWEQEATAGLGCPAMYLQSAGISWQLLLGLHHEPNGCRDRIELVVQEKGGDLAGFTATSVSSLSVAGTAHFNEHTSDIRVLTGWSPGARCSTLR